MVMMPGSCGRPSGLAISGAWSSPRSAGVSLGPAGLVVASEAAWAGADTAAVAPASIRAISAPTATVSPSLTSCSVSTPPTGEGTSTVTLSVSKLAIGSSSATASPGCFNHWASVPSVIDSPSVGTWTSVATLVPLFRRVSDCGAAMAERCRNQGRLLGRMPLGEPCRGRSTGVAARILRPYVPVTRIGEAGFEQIFDEAPRAVVLRLFLRPTQAFEVGHCLQPLQQRLRREGIELLHANDLDAEVAGFVARFHQLKGELARAQDKPPRFALSRRVKVGNNATEVAGADEVGLCRNRIFVPKKRLRSHQDQGLAKVAQHLPPEDVEIIGRRGAVCDLQIVLRAKLQIAFEPRR